MRVGHHLFYPSKRTTPEHVALCHPSVPIGLLTSSHLCEKRIVKVFGTRNLIAASTRRVKPSVWKFAFAHDIAQGGSRARYDDRSWSASTTISRPSRATHCESALRSASLFRDSSLDPPRNTTNGFMLHTLAAARRIEQRLVERVCLKSRTSHLQYLEQHVLHVVIPVDPRQSQSMSKFWT
jgi:hypothetical protein